MREFFQVHVYRCHFFVETSNDVFCMQELATGVLWVALLFCCFFLEHAFFLSFRLLQEYVVVGDADTDALSHIFKTTCVSFLAVLVCIRLQGTLKRRSVSWRELVLCCRWTSWSAESVCCGAWDSPLPLMSSRWKAVWPVRSAGRITNNKKNQTRWLFAYSLCSQF